MGDRGERGVGGGGRGKGGCISPEDMSYLRGAGRGRVGEGRGSRRGRGRSGWASLAAAAKTSSDDSTSQALFFRLGGSERAGGWRGQLLPDVNSQAQSQDVR